MNVEAPSPAFLLLIPLLIGCDEAGGRPNAVVRDSAGVTIVENPAPNAIPTYSVSGPLLEIGEVAGAEEYELHDVAGVVRLSDRRIAVATGGIEIRWFDAAGAFQQRSGGEGDGPGEYRRIRYLRALTGDSLLVFDSGTRRVSVLAPDGTYVRGRVLGQDETTPRTVAGALRDGTLLTRAVLETPPASTPMYRTRMEFAVSTGDTAHPLRRYPGPEAALHADEGGGGIGSVFISVLPFARSVHAAAGPDHFFVGSSDTYEIDVWDGERLVRIIRVDAPLVEVTEDLRQEYITAELDRSLRAAQERGRPFDEPAARRQLNDQRYAPAVPAFDGLLATEDGGLWVKAFVLPSADPRPERWTIFDRDGRMAGVIDLPPGFTPMYVEQDTVLGVLIGDLDVPYVRGYTFGL